MTEKDRYEYWEESDTAYDTKIHYGQYFRIIDKKECVRLLNKKEEEITVLKSTNMEMEDYLGRLEERIIELEKENESIQNKLYDLIYYFIIKYDIDMEEIKLYLNGGNLK